jgi:hypothetical protein
MSSHSSKKKLTHTFRVETCVNLYRTSIVEPRSPSELYSICFILFIYFSKFTIHLIALKPRRASCHNERRANRVVEHLSRMV